MLVMPNSYTSSFQKWKSVLNLESKGVTPLLKQYYVLKHIFFSVCLFFFHLWINLQASSKDVVRQLCQESFSTSALGSKKLLDITCSSLSVTQEEAEQVSMDFGHWILNLLVSFLTSQSLLCPRKCVSWNIYWHSKLNIDLLKMLVKLKTVSSNLHFLW